MELALNNKELNWFEFMVDNRFFYKLPVLFFNKVAQSVLCDKFRVQSTTFCQNFIVQKMATRAPTNTTYFSRSKRLFCSPIFSVTFGGSNLDISNNLQQFVAMT